MLKLKSKINNLLKFVERGATLGFLQSLKLTKLEKSNRI
jgi:hypothetical protein